MTSGLPSVLDTIVAASRRRVETQAAVVPRAELERQIARAGRPDARQAFATALQGAGVRIIAECKRRSPSRGVLRQDYDPVDIAVQYAASGAAAISVLTEPAFFDGSLAHLQAVRARVSVPLLRKDFIIDPYQVAEAAAAGADAILLIVAALNRSELEALLACAGDFGLAALVEVHDDEEAARAVDAGAGIVGVNNRNLRTLEVSIETSHRVRRLLPDDCITVAESGLRTGEDIAALAAAGFDAFLIGERFMTEDAPGRHLATLLADAARAMRGERP
jgi:indole-3-glycerol phosphate synthase